MLFLSLQFLSTSLLHLRFHGNPFVAFFTFSSLSHSLLLWLACSLACSRFSYNRQRTQHRIIVRIVKMIYWLMNWRIDALRNKWRKQSRIQQPTDQQTPSSTESLNSSTPTTHCCTLSNLHSPNNQLTYRWQSLSRQKLHFFDVQTHTAVFLFSFAHVQNTNNTLVRNSIHSQKSERESQGCQMMATPTAAIDREPIWNGNNHQHFIWFTNFDLLTWIFENALYKYAISCLIITFF